jgi:hypothetical protein
VFNYCHSKNFQQSLQFNDYLIIQIDTDVSEEQGYDISKSNQGSISLVQ